MKLKLLSMGVIFAALAGSQLPAGAASFEVTITNLTRDQRLTPILVASHKEGVKLFELGQPVSKELEVLAEDGDVEPLRELLNLMPQVLDTAASQGLLDPGASVMVSVNTRGNFDHLSLASMLIPTNDAFAALNGVAGPRGKQADTHVSVAYDAGSEPNDESCASMPAPVFAECGEPGSGGGPGGGGAPGPGEGYVHVHAGIHGIGDLDQAQRDWRNPVARIVVRRVRDDSERR